MRCRWVVAFVALAAVGSSNSSATRTPSAALKTRTLAVVRGHVDALAQDGPRVAWLFSDGACGRRVVLLDLRQRKRLSLEQRHGPSCSFGNAPLEDVVAIGGRRVVWETSIGTGNTESTGRVVTAAANDRRNRSLGEVDQVYDELNDLGASPALVAGDRSTLAFFYACDLVDNCPRGVWSGVRKIVGRKSYRLFRVNRPLVLAAAGRNVAALEDLYPCACNDGPRWSPDGRRIAWSLHGAVHVIDADGGALRRISPARSPEPRWPRDAAEPPRWSPDGTKLAYGYRGRGGASEVYVVNADGSGDRRLGAGSEPRWSPSGRKLSFVRSGDVWTMNADGSGATRLTTDAQPHTGGAEWSPDGTELAVARNAGLYVIRADGSGQTRIAGGEWPENQAPQWSPLGGQIAWTHRPNVSIVDADGTGRRNVAEGANPTWSPDGRWIAFDRVTEGDGNVFVVRSAGGPAALITSSLNAGRPSWSPDGRKIVVGDDADASSHDRRTGGIYTIAADGSALKKLFPADRTGVEVRDVRTGARTASFVVHGDAYTMALSDSFVAVLVRTARARESVLQVYRLRTGALAASASVHSASNCEACSTLAISDGGIAVFEDGRRLEAFDAQTRAIRTIATAQTVPVALSIGDRRLVWVESGTKRSLVEAVVLPR